MVVRLLADVGHVSVQDTRLEGGGEHHTRLGAGNSLSEGEEQRHIAVDAMLLLELLCSLNSLAGGRQLYQNPVLAYPGILVELDETPGSGHHGVLVKGEPRIDFHGYMAQDLQYSCSKQHKKFINGLLNLLLL